jgi:biopolymer transport protein ExbD
MNFHKPRPEEPEINLIPFIDVLLALPVADSEQARDRPNEIIVAVASDGRYAVNKRPVDGRSVDALAAELSAVAAGSNEMILIISADATAAHQSVINVMDAARRAGIAKLTFATQSSNGGPRP